MKKRDIIIKDRKDGELIMRIIELAEEKWHGVFYDRPTDHIGYLKLFRPPDALDFSNRMSKLNFVSKGRKLTYNNGELFVYLDGPFLGIVKEKALNSLSCMSKI